MTAMEITYSFYNELPADAKDIRREVFVKEQGFKREFDEQDGVCQHLVVYSGGRPAATARLYRKRPDVYIVGRIAVRRQYRMQRLGSLLLHLCEERIRREGGRAIEIAAQLRAQGFYEKNGYIVTGGAFDDEGRPHVSMLKRL